MSSERSGSAFKRELMQLRSKLIERIAAAPPASKFQTASRHADIGHDQMMRDQRRANLARARAELEQVDTALDRLSQGLYGQCATCGEDIELERLRALPYAVNCIRCQRENQT